MGIYERFWSKADKGGECWEWTGAKLRHGYGVFTLFHRRPIKSHRMAYLLEVGGIPAGLCVLHECDNPSCVRPSHLFLGTNVDNIADKVRKGRQTKGERNPRAKLTKRQVDAIRAEYVPYKVAAPELANRYGVRPKAIYEIVWGNCWKEGPTGNESDLD